MKTVTIANVFTCIGKSKRRTHGIAMAVSALVLATTFAIGGATSWTLWLSLPIWFFIDGVMLAMATSYSHPHDGEFRGTDVVMGTIMVIASSIIFVGTAIYGLFVNR